MGSEASKAVTRRLRDPLFQTRAFCGRGIDVGAGGDGVGNWKSLFPQMVDCRDWDVIWGDGDAQFLEGIEDESYDFVTSSHCLEHMKDPFVALANWWRVLKPNGYLSVIIPDEDLYEQGQFPSTFNGDHKWTFTLFKLESWSPRSVNVVSFLPFLAKEFDQYTPKCIRLTLLDDTYRYELARTDQTGNPVTESAIEFVFQKLRKAA